LNNSTTTTTPTTTAKNNGITTLTFQGHVTSSATWPFDSRWGTCYRWSIVTMHLSGTIMEIWRLKVHVHRHTNAHKHRTTDRPIS